MEVAPATVSSVPLGTQEPKRVQSAKVICHTHSRVVYILTLVSV